MQIFIFGSMNAIFGKFISSVMNQSMSLSEFFFVFDLSSFVQLQGK